MLAKMAKFGDFKRPDLSPQDKVVISIIWKYFVWGALARALLALVWNRSFDVWTLAGGAFLGVIITVGILLAIAFDVIRVKIGGDRDNP